MDVWQTFMVAGITTIVAAAIGSLILIIHERVISSRRLKSTLLSLTWYLMLHCERMLYIINEFCGVRDNSNNINNPEKKSRISCGSIDINNLSKVFDNYFELPDKYTIRKEALLIVYDGIFQTAFHLNMKVEDRILPNDGPSTAYVAAVAFAGDKITGCIENLKAIYEMMKTKHGNDILSIQRNKLNKTINLYNKNIGTIIKRLGNKKLNELSIL